MRCYLEHVGEHIGNLQNMLQTNILGVKYCQNDKQINKKEYFVTIFFFFSKKYHKNSTPNLIFIFLPHLDSNLKLATIFSTSFFTIQIGSKNLTQFMLNPLWDASQCCTIQKLKKKIIGWEPTRARWEHIGKNKSSKIVPPPPKMHLDVKSLNACFTC